MEMGAAMCLSMPLETAVLRVLIVGRLGLLMVSVPLVEREARGVARLRHQVNRASWPRVLTISKKISDRLVFSHAARLPRHARAPESRDGRTASYFKPPARHARAPESRDG